MNTNDFYKQLMSEYTFDREEIKNAAMGKITGKKKTKKIAFPIKKVASVTAMAAAMVLAVGVGSVMLSSPPVTIEQPASSISPSDRFNLAVEAYEKADENTADANLYLTFEGAVSADAMRSILARTSNEGDIRVIDVYLDDGTVVSGSANIAKLFDYEDENILAVKIRCPGNYIRSLTDTNGVYLVEPEEAFANETFSVLDTNEQQPEYPVITQPASTQPPVTTPVKETTTQPPQTVPESETAATEQSVTANATETPEQTAQSTDEAPLPVTESEATAPESEPASSETAPMSSETKTAPAPEQSAAETTE